MKKKEEETKKGKKKKKEERARTLKVKELRSMIHECDHLSLKRARVKDQAIAAGLRHFSTN